MVSSSDKPKGSNRCREQGIPDLKWINANLPIQDVARELDLRFDAHGKIHCWHPEKHRNGDEEASVAVWKGHNRLKCFGCDKFVGPVDLVIDVRQVDVREAARWLSERFQVPTIPKGKHLEHSEHRTYQVGLEDPIQLLVRHGLWARLSSSTQRILPVLLSLGDKRTDSTLDAQTYRVCISYVAIRRYSGVKSDTPVSNALTELESIGWLRRLNRRTSEGIVRKVGEYLLTPYSDEVTELTNAIAEQKRVDIKREREFRRLKREERRRETSEKNKQEGTTSAAPNPACTRYKTLYSQNSDDKNAAISEIARNVV